MIDLKMDHLEQFCGVSEQQAILLAFVTVIRTTEESTEAAQSPRDIAMLVAAAYTSDLVLDLEQVEPAVQLLSSTIRDNISDHQSKNFAEQLLHITTDFLHKVIRNLTLAKKQVTDSCSSMSVVLGLCQIMGASHRDISQMRNYSSRRQRSCSNR